METKKSPTGFMLIDKPAGITSHAVISKLRWLTQIKKIGHAGTLDPFATGLLIVAIGRESTKKISEFVKMDKEYEAKILFGAETDTYDSEGKITKEYFCEKIKKKQINEVLWQFIGKQDQIPPMYSAKKVNGKKLYELARMNIEIERKPCQIEIFNLDLMKYSWPTLDVKIKCTSGTYIRTLAFDLGKKLQCGAYLKSLRRTKINTFDVSQAVKLEKLTTDNWQKYLFDLNK